jgi:small-conductance mechanosensitive channel
MDFAMSQDIRPWLVPFGKGLAELLVFWLAAKTAQRLTGAFGRRRLIDPDVTGVLAHFAYLALLVLGAITAAGTWGVNVSALVAGLGLTSLALGLALKEVLSNVLAGLLIMSYKPFHRGEHVNVPSVVDCQGVVTEVNLRYTLLQGEKGTVFVPNTILVTSAMIVGPGPPAAPNASPAE